MALEITITDEQKVKVTIAPNTGGDHPKPATLDGLPTWSIISGNCTLQPSGDGLSCDIISPDVADETVVGISADADLGPGVTTISDTVIVHVINAQAKSLGIIVGTPEPK